MKLLVLGLDGATFDIIDRLGDDHLPYLKGIIAGGVRGLLESTFPPVTGPAWTAFATGKNPGKTGVFGFRSRTAKDNFNMKMVTSTKFRQAGTWWDYLSDVGIKVGIWNYPVLYPPYPINGFMVGGFGCSPNDEFTYPRELKETLLDVCGDYTIDIPHQNILTDPCSS
jgi:predicted AlkP superfamily phosphohydrolase/phosphomutase